MNADTFCEHFATFAEAPNGVVKLREMILQLAVQGKLVPQDPNDEPAGELLSRIDSERATRIKAGKLRDSADNRNIELTIFPFQLPPNWCCVPLTQVMQKMGAGSTPLGGNKVYVDEGVMFLRSQNVWDAGLELCDVARISPDIHRNMSGTWVEPGDVLLNITGASIGRCSLVPDDFGEANVSQHVAILRLIDKDVRKFLHLCVISPFFQETIMRVQVGVSREGLSMTRLREFPFPLPPLAEQKRIVEKVDQLMKLCDELAARQAERTEARKRVVAATLDRLVSSRFAAEMVPHSNRVRDHFNRLFDTPTTIPQLRQAILQLAVQGQIVPQDPNDEPVLLLRQRLANRATELLREGRTTRPKPLPEIEESQVPYGLPVNWEWVRFGELAAEVDYGTSVRASEIGGDVPVLRMNAIRDGKVLLDDSKFVSSTIDDLPRLYLKNGDILFNRTNSFELVGKSGVFHGSDDKFTFASYLIRASLLQELSPDFVALAMNASYFRKTQIEPEVTQQCGQANFNGTKLRNCLIPLPPLAEQNRIVAKVNQLMSLCNALEAKLTQAESASAHLLSASVHRLLQVG